MGVNNAELYLNIGMCCFFCQQLDFAIGCIDQAHASADDDVQADLWYNTAHIALISLLVGWFNGHRKVFRPMAIQLWHSDV